MSKLDQREYWRKSLSRHPAGGTSLLFAMLADRNVALRRIAVTRLPARLLPLAADDPDPKVRQVVARRIRPAFLAALEGDTDPGVRFVVAGRLPESALAPFLDDPDRAVRDLAYRRVWAASARHVRALMGGRMCSDTIFPCEFKELTQ